MKVVERSRALYVVANHSQQPLLRIGQDDPVTDRLAPGDPAPDFTLTSDTGDAVSLADLRGTKVIVYFYPAAMTPGCTKQACDFTDNLASLKAAGYEVLGIS